MRFGLKPFLINIFFVALFTGSTAVWPASFDYLYVEASEGNSSGGHSALQFGDEVYHYQHHDSGLIRLLRQDKQEFHFLYRFLQNRRIHLSHIEVSEDTINKLREHFKMQFLAQDQQFKQLNQIHRDRALLHRLLKQEAHEALPDADSSSVLKLNGAGLFYDGQDLKKTERKLNGMESRSLQVIESLRQQMAQNYGQDFLLHRREKIIRDIKTKTPSHWPVGQEILSKDHFPTAINSFADSVEDDLTGLAAIKVLMERQPLRPDAFFVADQSGFAVSLEERQVLEKLRDQLTVSTVKSINSGRPDWGYAVLVNMARLLAVDLSLQLGQWVFIDDFASDSEWVSADQFARYAGQMQIQINDALTNLAQAKIVLLNNGLTETNYSRLEMSANRYFELLKGRQHKAVRYTGESALPTKSIILPDWIAPELTQQQLKTALAELDHYENRLLHELTDHYRYNLITRNCVTELFRTIDQSWLQRPESAEWIMTESTDRLGGNISATYNFIPFVSFQSVQAHYNVNGSIVLNSYRRQKLEKLYARDNALMTALRESNTLTSTLYRYNPDDAFFIFFTDDNAALRPIFGLFNTVAGMGQTAVGLFSWPFDSGRNLESGVTGVLMSLPELFFFNMRKGSYKYLSYHQFVQEEK